MRKCHELVISLTTKQKKNIKQALGAFHLYSPHVTLHSEILYFYISFQTTDCIFNPAPLF